MAPQRDGREEWCSVWVNELHGDYLAYERLAQRRLRAARAALVSASRPPRAGSLQRLLAGVGRALRLF